MTADTRAAAKAVEFLQDMIGGWEVYTRFNPDEPFEMVIDAGFVAALRTVLDALPEWNPIESAPRDGTRIDIWVPREGRLVNCWHQNGLWLFDSSIIDDDTPGVVYEAPTHWMPIPPPPEEQQKESE